MRREKIEIQPIEPFQQVLKVLVHAGLHEVERAQELHLENHELQRPIHPRRTGSTRQRGVKLT